jgi:hypothetical protein
MKCDILKHKWVSIRCGAGVFTWTKEEEKGDTYHVGNSLVVGGAIKVVSYSEEVQDQSNWDRLDPFGRWVSLGVTS